MYGLSEPACGQNMRPNHPCTASSQHQSTKSVINQGINLKIDHFNTWESPSLNDWMDNPYKEMGSRGMVSQGYELMDKIRWGANERMKAIGTGEWPYRSTERAMTSGDCPKEFSPATNSTHEYYEFKIRWRESHMWEPKFNIDTKTPSFISLMKKPRESLHWSAFPCVVTIFSTVAISHCKNEHQNLTL